MATHILTDGSSKEVQPKNGKTFSLEELNGFVGGWIEMLRLPSGGWLILNEEGKLKDPPLPPNSRATLMGRACGIADDDVIVGNVLVARSSEID